MVYYFFSKNINKKEFPTWSRLTEIIKKEFQADSNLWRGKFFYECAGKAMASFCLINIGYPQGIFWKSINIF